MANPSTRFFSRTVTSPAFDLKLAQGVCFVGSVVVLGSSWWKLWRLELTEVQLLFGVQLSLVAPLLLVIIGLLLPSVLPPAYFATRPRMSQVAGSSRPSSQTE